MARGRPPKPHEVHEKEGTLRPDRHSPLPVVLGERSLGAAPDTLTPTQTLIWDYLVRELSGARLLQSTDAPMLEQLAVAVDYARQSSETIQAEGLIFEEERYDKEGNVVGVTKKRHPAYMNWKDSVQTAKTLAEHFGLTPSARARLGIQAAVGLSAAKQLEKTIGVNPLDFLEEENKRDDPS